MRTFGRSPGASVTAIGPYPLELTQVSASRKPEIAAEGGKEREDGTSRYFDILGRDRGMFLRHGDGVMVTGAANIGELSVKLADAALMAREKGDDVNAIFFAVKAAETLALAKALGWKPDAAALNAEDRG